MGVGVVYPPTQDIKMPCLGFNHMGKSKPLKHQADIEELYISKSYLQSTKAHNILNVERKPPW